MEILLFLVYLILLLNKRFDLVRFLIGKISSFQFPIWPLQLLVVHIILCRIRIQYDAINVKVVLDNGFVNCLVI